MSSASRYQLYTKTNIRIYIYVTIAVILQLASVVNRKLSTFEFDKIYTVYLPQRRLQIKHYEMQFVSFLTIFLGHSIQS